MPKEDDVTEAAAKELESFGSMAAAGARVHGDAVAGRCGAALGVPKQSPHIVIRQIEPAPTEEATRPTRVPGLVGRP